LYQIIGGKVRILKEKIIPIPEKQVQKRAGPVRPTLKLAVVLI